jgi:diadenosine tetraphosphate (Ap4A) HIT family hydrolase
VGGIVSNGCHLCEGPKPVVRESTRWVTVINRNQDLLGKTFIALRRHEENVTALTSEEWSELQDEVAWITKRVAQAFQPDHFNYAFLMNQDPHVHLHVIPRYIGVRELAGSQFTDPDYPDAYRASVSGAGLASADVIAALEVALSA